MGFSRTLLAVLMNENFSSYYFSACNIAAKFCACSPAILLPCTGLHSKKQNNKTKKIGKGSFFKALILNPQIPLMLSEKAESRV